MTNLDSVLSGVLDRNAIYDVVVRYCRAVDSRDWHLMSDVFEPGAVVDFGSEGSAHGVDEIVKWIRNVEDKVSRSQHLLGNFVVNIEGDTATATTYFQAQHYSVNGTGSNTYLIGGTYHDKLRRTPAGAGWRIEHKYIEPVWYDGNAGLFATS